MQVALSQPVKIELVDEEIITLAGCDLGFIMPGKPPQVLQVEQGSEMAAHNIRTDDVLVGVDGRDTRSVSKDELEQLLRTALRLSFERPRVDGDVDMKPAAELSEKADAPPKEPPPDVEVPQAAAPAPLAPLQLATAVSSAASAAPAAPVAAAKELRSGMLVKLVGFQSATMNGARGRLGKFSEKQGSWQVFLESTSAAKAVRPQNLEAVPADEQMPDAGAQVPANDGGTASGAAQSGRAPANGRMPIGGLSPVAATMAAAMRGVVPVPALPHFDGPGPPPGPEWQEDVVPTDEDKESWVELMRDAYVRQLRTDAEHPEPPPFHRADHFSGLPAPGQPLAEGKYPAQALNFQLQMLLRARTGDFPTLGMAPYGPGCYGQYNSWMPGRRFGKGFGGGFVGVPRGPARWMPGLPGGLPCGAPMLMGMPGEPPRIVFPPNRG